MNPERAADSPGRSGRSVTSRALSVLDTFDGAHRALSVSEIARRAGMPVATAHRLVGELCRWGALESTPTQHYVVGRRLWEIALLSPRRSNIIELASPHMQDVLYETQSVVNLFVLDGTEAVLVTRISGTNVGDPLRQVGERLPLHASAAGKVLLAYGSDALRESLRRSGLRAFTPHTIDSHEQLAAELVQVRRAGYAVTNEELGVNNFGIAVPVVEHGVTRLALGVVTKEAPRNIGIIVPVLRLAARAIARKVEADGLSIDPVRLGRAAEAVLGA
ncbi:IclR family transcriptional regulator [Leucobacter sp. W1038]|uniref:IclR family transcriptional regulator n=1 Tax=Leucobacter sp. W1038 TaxID=3438281 RepID=UPI003D96FFA9